LQDFAKTLLNPAIIAFAEGMVSHSINRNLWRRLVWLFLAVAATAVMVALATGVSQAHDENYCDGDGDYDHYIEDVNPGPPGRYLLWMSTKHDDLFVRAGDGVSAVSIENTMSDTFNYLGYEITVEDAEIYKIYYTTSKREAVLEVCFSEEVGFWHLIPVDGNGQPLTNIEPHTNSPPQPTNQLLGRQDLEIDGSNRTIDLNPYFTDPDSDTLTYTAVPSDTAKATTSVSRSTLTITPIATGVIDITVTASDGSHSASTGFTVVVYKQPDLRPPTEMSGIVDSNAVTPVTAGSLTVIFPSGSMSNYDYYQARIDPESNACGTDASEDNEYLCLSVDLFDLAADPIDANLSQNARMVLTLDQTQATAVKNAIDDETLTFSLSRWDRTPPGSWTDIPNCPGPVETSECYTFATDGNSGTIEVINISGFSEFTTSIPTPEPPKRPASTSTRSGGGSGSGGISPRSNQRPSLDVDDDSLRYKENGTKSVATFSADDPDDDDLSWHVDGLDSKAFKISDDGVLSFKTSPDFENPADRDGDNRYEIRVKVADDGSPSRSDSQDVRIRVTNQNELNAISGDTEFTVPEGETGHLAQFEVEDPENDDIAWSLGGHDAGAFLIDEEGNLSLESAFDFETPSSAAASNVHSLTITAIDDGSPQVTSELQVAVTVSNVNEAPTSTEIPAIQLTLGDNPATVPLGDFFTDPDGDSLTYSIDGLTDPTVASGTFEGDNLSISPVGVGSLSFELSGNDAGGLSASTTVNVTVVAPPIVRTLDPDRDYDEIIRPIVTRYSDPPYALVLKPILDPAASSALEETPSTTEGLTRKPIPAVSLRRMPASTPAPTVMAPAPVAPTPTAVPTPIRTSISRPTPSAQPTQHAPQASSSPATRQPTVVPVEKAPVSPRTTATPAPEPTTTAAEDDSRNRLPLWLIILLILAGLLAIASMPLWIVNLLIIAGLVALALALASVPLWLIILLAVAFLIVLALVGLVYGIITRGW
jgi:hypothetical protein